MLSRFLFTGISCLLFSCYSFTATTLPSHIKTVNIADVDFRTFDPVIGNRLKDGIRELFRINAPAIRIINDDADADFTVTLLSYSNRPETQSSSAEVETYRVTMGVSVSFYDNVRKKVIYESKNVQAIGSYDVQKNESEEMQGQERAIKALQEIIVANALAKW
ncbi:MAG: LPS assembly lipoprotein LptE [Fibromonadaceae bacterium]|nr:LPS assembly lipoprotein LptE [Fibromonadaceae bacterium]